MNPSAPNKTSWLMAAVGLTVAPIIYYVVGLQVAGATRPLPTLPTLRLALLPVAAVLVVIGVVLVRRAPRAGVGEATGDVPAAVARFMASFMMGAALIESAAVVGFLLVMLGGPVRDYLPFGAATLAAMVTVALPTGLGYWSERERADAAMK